MDTAQAKKAVVELLTQKPQLFVLSTVDEAGAPQSRLMGAILLKDWNILYMASDSDARKVTQIEKNPNVQVLCWSADCSAVATVSGTATMEKSAKSRKEFWDAVPACAKHYSGPDDAGLGIIRIRLREGEYLDCAAGYEVTRVEF